MPVVAIHGPRQVGKTTLARRVAEKLNAVYFDLEDPSHFELFKDARAVFDAYGDRLIVIDEAQRRPELFPLLRVVVDEDRRPGRFLLLGSASPDLSRQRAESLAGRVSVMELPPLSYQEVEGVVGQDDLWLRGGFPLSLLESNKEAGLMWRRDFLRDFFERDLKLLGFDLAPDRARRLFLMLAHVHGQLWNASTLARSLDVRPATVNRYLDALVQTYLVRRIEPYYTNIGKRLRKSPKVYIADSGLLHVLLEIPDKQRLLEHPVLGFSWEGFVLAQICAMLPFGWEASFWRTSAGAEIDILLLHTGLPRVAIEVKANRTNPRPRRGFTESCRDLAIEERWMVHSGESGMISTLNVQTMSLPEMLNKLATFL